MTTRAIAILPPRLVVVQEVVTYENCETETLITEMNGTNPRYVTGEGFEDMWKEETPEADIDRASPEQYKMNGVY